MPINRIVIYTKRIEAMVAFYQTHFGFVPHQDDGDRIVELVAPNGGANIMLYPAPKSKKEGQTIIKLVFDVRDVEGFKQISAEKGLKFGPIHQADGYSYANAKDPSKNNISISSRAFRK